MKILRLDINGFRSLKDVSWTPGDLNVVIGPNATGKSNLLRILELISVSAQGRLGKYIQNSGGMEPLVWDGSLKGIQFSLKASPLYPYWFIERNWLIYQVNMTRLGMTSSYRIDNELLSYFHRDNSGTIEEPFKMLERKELTARVFDEDKKELVAPEESLSEDETLLSLLAGPFALHRDIPPFRSELIRWSIYHDLYFGQDSVIRQATISRHEKRVDPDGKNLIPVLHTLYTGDRDFKKDIDLAMRAAFGNDYDELVFPPAADQRIQLRVRWKSLRREQTAADLSDGTLRFLFLLTVLASPSPAPVIAIDEPETGLHPSMLPIVAEYAVDAAERVQVILTTHSPQFLDAFDDTTPTTTVTKWANGETVLKTLSGEKLDRWLKEYSLGSLYGSGELEDMAEDAE
jgi:predicted ATPase